MKDEVIKMQRLVDRAMLIPKYSYPMYVNAAKPPEPFAAVRYVTERNPGIDKIELVEEEGRIFSRTTGVRVVIFEVLFTGGSADASRLTGSFKRQDMQDQMVAGGMTILNAIPIQNETLSLETNWEIRDGLQVICLTKRQWDTDDVDIQAAIIDGTFNEAFKEYNFEINVDIKEPLK